MENAVMQEKKLIRNTEGSEPFHRVQHYNCIENCIAVFCKTYDINHRSIFINSWDFGYHEVSAYIGENIHYHASFDFELTKKLACLKKYSSVEFKFIRNIDLQSVLFELDNRHTLLIEIDTFTCKWANTFEKEHHIHFYLINSYDIDAQLFHVIDPIYSDRTKECSFSEIFSFQSICSLRYVNSVKKDSFNMYEDFINYVRSVKHTWIIHNIHNFGKALMEARDLHFVTPPCEDLFQSHIVRRLTHTINSRVNLYEFLSYLKEYHDFHHSYLSEIIELWKKVRYEVIKGLMIKRIDIINEAGKNVVSIARAEKNYSDILLDQSN